MNDMASSLTSASLVYDRLRGDILRGTLRASEKLRIDALRDRYGVGPIPLREALNRLLSEGFVALQDRKGFYVPAVSLEELDELTRTRCWLNEIIVRESLRAGDSQWEERVILSSHYLGRTPRAPSMPTGIINPDWERRHRDFHVALMESCPSHWLRDYHASLFDLADRYRHQYLSARAPVGARDVTDEHETMREMALSRNIDGLIETYNSHIERTTAIIVNSVQDAASKVAAA